MSHYTLSVVTYDRGERWDNANVKKPYHWSLFLAPSNATKRIGAAYQLRGMPGGFYYKGEEANVDLDKSSNLKESLEIGTIPAEKIDRFRQLLETVKIDNDESTKWNCQDWSLEAIDMLRLEGFISEDYSNHVIQHWLREN